MDQGVASNIVLKVVGSNTLQQYKIYEPHLMIEIFLGLVYSNLVKFTFIK